MYLKQVIGYRVGIDSARSLLKENGHALGNREYQAETGRYWYKRIEAN
jgi:hypothetical protein